jgi:hypothetical protein
MNEVRKGRHNMIDVFEVWLRGIFAANETEHKMRRNKYETMD